MVKKIIISILIIVGVISLDIVTQVYTNKTSNEIRYYLTKIKTNPDVEENKKKAIEINQQWELKKKVLSYYIEHNELEKISKSLVSMKSYFEIDDISSGTEQLDEASFLLKHLEDKYSFNLQNIF